ncbi:DnaJ domain-containing protein [Microbacterium sp. NC79]|uniref:DnaJ domain-containing protein n=1 Tax=Microbacterium sp. NC79 TaxID=2851009 RepID=UPI001C2CBE59|nr:DnaJ domain-containing protein [Microbacterium sp. NC79]
MFDSPLSASAYEILQVAVTATEEELRRAYRVRLRHTHPDTGGDAAQFVLVQRAWELVGTAQARAAYDRGHGFGTAAPHVQDFAGFRAQAAPSTTRPGPRTYGQPGGRNRERYLAGIREFAGRGVQLFDPYDPALVRSAPRELKQLLADALAEETTARVLSELGMGYTLWHDVAVPTRSGHALIIDHIVLGPSGLYAVASEDYGTAVRFKRSEVIGDGVPSAPIATLVGAARTLGRVAGVRFGGAMLVLPDEDLPETITELGRVKSLPVAVVSPQTLTTMLRRGVTGVPDIGGNEIFDVRTRLQRTVQFA